MRGFGTISRGIAIATLLCFAAPQAEAIEVYGAGAAATRVDDGLLVQVRGGGTAAATRHGGGITAAEAECIAAAAAPWNEPRQLQSRTSTPRIAETSTGTSIATSTGT